MMGLGIPFLEEATFGNVLRKGSILQRLYAQCQQEKLDFSLLSIFCYEGNNIPEAIQMADVTEELLLLNHGLLFSSFLLLSGSL
jgi:hypothetical protein